MLNERIRVSGIFCEIDLSGTRNCQTACQFAASIGNVNAEPVYAYGFSTYLHGKKLGR
jgi:hypothetical protein